MSKPKLVAHRGFAAKYPENSKSAFNAAIALGGAYLELDVQLTADHIPIVIHDTTLARTGEDDTDVLCSEWQSLQFKTIGERQRLGDKYKNETLITLADFADLLRVNSQVHAFVEIKEESVAKFGVEIVANSMMQTLADVKQQCSIISFDSSILFHFRKIYPEVAIGFVLHKYDDEHKIVAEKMQPDILICNYKKIPDEDGSLWEGDWDSVFVGAVFPGLIPESAGSCSARRPWWKTGAASDGVASSIVKRGGSSGALGGWRKVGDAGPSPQAKNSDAALRLNTGAHA